MLQNSTSDGQFLKSPSSQEQSPVSSSHADSEMPIVQQKPLRNLLMRINDRVDTSEQFLIIYRVQCKDFSSSYTGKI